MSSASFLLALLLMASVALAQDGDTDTPSGEQDSESKALDSTATQWSFQFAWQQTELENRHGQRSAPAARPGQFCPVAYRGAVLFEKFTLLPRLTLRHYENVNNGDNGLGNTELFGLIVPKKWDWGTGRVGIGPLVTFPGNDKVAKDEWGYGFAAAAVNTSGNWFYGLLFTQSWRAVDPAALPVGTSDTNPLGIAPFLNYQLGGGWYVGNGDMVVNYDWDSNEVLHAHRGSFRQGVPGEGQLEHLQRVPDQPAQGQLVGSRGEGFLSPQRDLHDAVGNVEVVPVLESVRRHAGGALTHPPASPPAPPSTASVVRGP